MDQEIYLKINEFIKNRNEKGESTSSRHIHIRFGLEINKIDECLKELEIENQISAYHDSDYQEERYIPKDQKSVRE